MNTSQHVDATRAARVLPVRICDQGRILDSTLTKMPGGLSRRRPQPHGRLPWVPDSRGRVYAVKMRHRTRHRPRRDFLDRVMRGNGGTKEQTVRALLALGTTEMAVLRICKSRSCRNNPRPRMAGGDGLLFCRIFRRLMQDDGSDQEMLICR